jgi:hypothetical protein
MRCLALACALTLSAASAHAQPVADFYRGKQIRIIVGSTAGDYDTWARVVGRHLRRHIPGSPGIIV